MAAVAGIKHVVAGNATILKLLRELKIGEPPADSKDKNGWVHYKAGDRDANIRGLIALDSRMGRDR